MILAYFGFNFIVTVITSCCLPNALDHGPWTQLRHEDPASLSVGILYWRLWRVYLQSSYSNPLAFNPQHSLQLRASVVVVDQNSHGPGEIMDFDFKIRLIFFCLPSVLLSEAVVYYSLIAFLSSHAVPPFFIASQPSLLWRTLSDTSARV